MGDGNPPMTFLYGIAPPPSRDEPKYILPVPSRPRENSMEELIRRVQEMQNAPSLAQVVAKLDKVEERLARINNQVATINEFIAALRAVPSTGESKRRDKKRRKR